MSDESIKAAIAAKLAAIDASLSAEPIGPPDPPDSRLSELERAEPRSSRLWGFTTKQRNDLFHLLTQALNDSDKKRREFIVDDGSSWPIPHDPKEIPKTIWMFLRSVDLEYQQYKGMSSSIPLPERRKHRSTGAPRGRPKRDDLRRFVRMAAHHWENILGLRPTAYGGTGPASGSPFFEFIMSFIEEEGLGVESGRTYVRDAIKDLGRRDDVWLTDIERQAIAEEQDERANPTDLSPDPAGLDAWLRARC